MDLLLLRKLPAGDLKSPHHCAGGEYIPACRCQAASDPGERVFLGAPRWSGRISVRGEAGWAGETCAATPKKSQNEPYYYLKEARAVRG